MELCQGKENCLQKLTWAALAALGRAVTHQGLSAGILAPGAVLEAVAPRLLRGDVGNVCGEGLCLSRACRSWQLFKSFSASCIFEGMIIQREGLMAFLEDLLADLPLVRVEGVPAALEEAAVGPGRVFVVAIPSEFFQTVGGFKLAPGSMDGLAGRESPVKRVVGWRRGAGAVRRV